MSTAPDALRILFIHEVNYRSKVVYEMHEFPELLARRGHDVTFFHYPEGAGSSARSSRTRVERVSGRAYPSAEIRLVTPPTLGGGAGERYLAPLIDYPALRREIVHGGYDAIVLYAVPTTGWQTVLTASSAGVPVIFRALDVSHEIRRSPVAPVIRAAERTVYRRADLVAANNPALADYCVEMSGRRGPTTVLPPPVDLSHFAGSPPRGVRERYGIGPDERVILYMGTFFSFSGLDTVIDRLAPALRASSDLRLVLVGGGELDGLLRRRAQTAGLGDRVLFTGVVPYADLPAHLAMADIAVNPFRRIRATDLALPHKVLQYAAAGVPAVSTRLAGLHGVLGEDSGVLWADDPASVADLALSALAEPSRLGASAGRLRRRVAEIFDIEAAADGLERAIRDVR